MQSTAQPFNSYDYTHELRFPQATAQRWSYSGGGAYINNGSTAQSNKCMRAPEYNSLAALKKKNECSQQWDPLTAVSTAMGRLFHEQKRNVDPTPVVMHGNRKPY